MSESWRLGFRSVDAQCVVMIWEEPRDETSKKRKNMKNLYIIAGRSGSGKTSVVQELCSSCGLKPVKTTTTRPRHFPEEDAYHFISQDEFDIRSFFKSSSGCFSFSMIFSFLAIFHVLRWTFLNFPPFSVFLAILHVRNVYFSFSVIFSFLAIFQVLQCAFLIFHVF